MKLPEGLFSKGKICIGNEWTDGAGDPFSLENPAKREKIMEVKAASKDDVAKAYRFARQVFDSGAWSQTSVEERSKVLKEISNTITANARHLEELDVLCMGKSVKHAQMDIEACSDTFRFYSDLLLKVGPKLREEVKLEDPSFQSHIEMHPKGVIAAVTPWNFPLLMAVWKIAPAIAAGNCILLKPSEFAPLSCMELVHLAQEAGLPKGVFTVLPGLGVNTGKALVSIPDLDYITFTGSGATGKAIMLAAAENLVPCHIELGGKSPIIVFQDADIDFACDQISEGIWHNQGQVCSATSRLLVHESIKSEVVEKLIKMATKMKVGDGMNEENDLGSISSEMQYNKICHYIRSAIKEDATLRCGGEPQSSKDGFFINPTIFDDVTPSMTIWKEEIFGPVLAVVGFNTEEEAIKLANDTPYGLAGAVITKDKALMTRVTNNLQAGIIWQNCNGNTYPQAPWTPWKKSGFGVDLSEHSFFEYLRLKQVTSLREA